MKRPGAASSGPRRRADVPLRNGDGALPGVAGGEELVDLGEGVAGAVLGLGRTVGGAADGVVAAGLGAVGLVLGVADGEQDDGGEDAEDDDDDEKLDER